MSNQHVRVELPREPIDRLTAPLERFLHVETAGGIVLLLATVAALLLANSPWSESFLGFWQVHVGLTLGSFHLDHSLQHWINDGLMALFFFVVGLEVKREFAIGQLRDPRQAALPVAAALGGMLFPAGVYFLLQNEGPAARGWGIPMATDIAFVVGCLAILGRRIPSGLRVMMLTLAIVDDIGAILVIALGYSSGLNWIALGAGALGIAVVSLLARLGVRNFPAYVVLGIGIWLAFLGSGVHATIAGVILGIMTPASSYLSTSALGNTLRRAGDLIEGDWDAQTDRALRVRELQWATREAISPLEYLESMLHPWVGFVIMPVFALANAGVVVNAADLSEPVALAIVAGLVVGKFVGVSVVSWLAVRVRVAQLPPGVSWSMIGGGALLAGIGFTMSIFIAGLALPAELLAPAKLGILCASFLAAVLGMGWLVLATRRRAASEGGTAHA